MQKGLPETYQNLVRVIGMDAALRLCGEYGGSVLYIPKLDRLQASRRIERIRAEWNGRNNENWPGSTAYPHVGCKRP